MKAFSLNSSIITQLFISVTYFRTMLEIIKQSHSSTTSILHTEALHASSISESLESISPANPSTCESIHEAILLNSEFYFFAVLTGIIFAKPGEYSKSITKINIRFRTWSWFIVIALIVSVIWFFYNAIAGVIDTSSSSSLRAVDFINSCAYAAQAIVVLPAIEYVRRVIIAKREVNYAVFKQHFEYSVNLSWKFLYFWIVVAILFACLTGYANSEYLTLVINICSTIFTFVIIMPSNLFLMGILSFLIYEQRVSRQLMEETLKDIADETLTVEKYFTVREEMETRDRAAPINLMLLSCIVSVIAGLSTLFWVFVDENDKMIGNISYQIFLLIAVFGRPYAVILMVLVEIVGVNERAERIPSTFAKYTWQSTPDQSVRFSLYMAAKEFPLGSMIVFMRPSKFELVTQVVSSIVGVIFAAFWAIFFA